MGGWEFTLKAPLGLVSKESYPTTRCDWGMPFFSPLLKCAAYSDSGYCGAHKWLSEEKGMEKERVGSRFKRKPPIGTPILLSNLSRQKEQQSHSQGHLEGENESFRTAFFVSESQFSSTAQRVNSSLLTWLHAAPALVVCVSSWIVSWGGSLFSKRSTVLKLR